MAALYNDQAYSHDRLKGHRILLAYLYESRPMKGLIRKHLALPMVCKTMSTFTELICVAPKIACRMSWLFGISQEISMETLGYYVCRSIEYPVKAAVEMLKAWLEKRPFQLHAALPPSPQLDIYTRTRAFSHGVLVFALGRGSRSSYATDEEGAKQPETSLDPSMRTIKTSRTHLSLHSINSCFVEHSITVSFIIKLSLIYSTTLVY